MRLSIVTTLYYSAPHIEEFCNQAAQVAADLFNDYEIVLVNDGSPDDSLARALRLRQGNPKIRIADLSRHHGHYLAILAGLTHSHGDYVFLIDCDLEESPALLKTFWQELRQSTDLDLIYGVQSARRGTIFKRYSGAFYYRLFNLVSKVEIPMNSIVARLMTRRYVDALLSFGERPISFDALATLTGFGQKAVSVEKSSDSPSTYSFPRRISLAVNSLIAFSNWPLKAILVLGVAFVAASLIAAGWLLSWSSVDVAADLLLVSLWFLGGATLVAIGILGLYLNLVLAEARRRPTVVKKFYEEDEM